VPKKAADVWLNRIEQYPSHVVAKWLGHSPKVAAQHYLMSRDHDFEDVVNGESKVPAVIAGEDPNGVAACDANCDSAGVRSRQHAAARNDRTRGHHSGYRGFFGSYAVSQNGPNGGGRIRTCDLEVMSLASYRAAPPRVRVLGMPAKPTAVNRCIGMDDTSE
jgi:hypothetical protein